jgi:osmotically-inducible protein OsmY
MKKTDSQLQHDVMAELEWEPAVDHADIGVAVNDGVVTLSGYVKNFTEKLAAEKAVRRVAGVRAIAEEIKVRLASDSKLADHEIAKRILDMIAWTVSIPNDMIKVKVEHGWVTLSGTVDWYFQSNEARKAAAKVSGVVGVSNLIEVKQHPAPADVKDLGLQAAGGSRRRRGYRDHRRRHGEAERQGPRLERAQHRRARGLVGARRHQGRGSSDGILLTAAPLRPPRRRGGRHSFCRWSEQRPIIRGRLRPLRRRADRAAR